MSPNGTYIVIKALLALGFCFMKLRNFQSNWKPRNDDAHGYDSIPYGCSVSLHPLRCIIRREVTLLVSSCRAMRRPHEVKRATIGFTLCVFIRHSFNINRLTRSRKDTIVIMRNRSPRPGCVITISGIESIIPRYSGVPTDSVLNFATTHVDRKFKREFNHDFQVIYDNIIIPQLKDRLKKDESEVLDHKFGFVITFSHDYRVLCITNEITFEDWIGWLHNEWSTAGIDSIVFLRQPKNFPKVYLMNWASENRLTFSTYSPPKLNNLFEIASQRKLESEKDGKHCDIRKIAVSILQSIVANALYDLFKQTFSLLVKYIL